MAIIYEKIVEEDLELGHGTASRHMPAGGTATGTKITLGTFNDSAGVAYATLPAASAAKGRLETVNNSTTKTAGATVAGGGAYFVLAWSNGTNWIVISGY